MKRAFLTSILLAAFLLSCEQKTTIKLAEKTCDIDIDNLDGVWVMEKPDPEKGHVLDQKFRLKFFKEEGVEKVINTAGSYNKYTYSLDTGKSTPSRKIYMEDIEWPKEKLEEFKRTNVVLGLKMQGKLYVEVNEKLCRLQVSDHFITYVRGELFEDSNIGGTGLFLRYDEKPLSFVHCKNTEGIKVYDGKGGKLKVKESLDAVYETFELNRPIYFKLLSKMKDDGAAHCNYTFDIYRDDYLAVTGMVPGEKRGKRIWDFEHTFSEPGWHFLEIYRYKECAGQRDLIEVACTKVNVK